MYIVIKPFVDIQDDCHRYSVGDKFPHADKNISMRRINELMSDTNRQKQPLIKEVVEKAEETVSESTVSKKKRRKSNVGADS